LTFPFSVEVTVRGYEIDFAGHVNHAVYALWVEHARWELWRALGLDRECERLIPVVRHVEADYLGETFLGDRLEIRLWPRWVRRTSFALGGSIRVAAADDPERIGREVHRTTVVLVCVRPGKGRIPVPDSWRPWFPAEDPGPQS